jgi:putative transposase
MSKLIRHYSPGQIYFVTAVKYSREPILIEHVALLRASLRSAKQKYGHKVIAWVFLPDHLHLIVEPREADLSKIMHGIKLSFARMLLNHRTSSTGPIWQRRFWDHIIRDGKDFRMHLDYIHYNSVKHNYVTDPAEWRASSFRTYRRNGFYADGWGSFGTISVDGDFGE